MHDLARLRYAAEQFHDPQGLRQLPLFVALLVHFSLTRDGDMSDIIHLAIFGVYAAAFGLHRLLNGHYRRRFGYQRPRPRSELRVAALGLATIVGIPLVIGLGRVERVLQPPISLQGLVLVSPVVFAFARAPRRRWYYGVAAAVTLAILLLPAAGVLPMRDLFNGRKVFLYAWAGLLAVCSVLDHLLLVRLFSPPQRGPELEHSV